MLEGIDVQNMKRAIFARALRKLSNPNCDSIAIDFQPTPTGTNPSGMAMKITTSLGYHTNAEAYAVTESSFDTLRSELTAQSDAFENVDVVFISVANPREAVPREPDVVTGDIENIAAIQIGDETSASPEISSFNVQGSGWFMCWAFFYSSYMAN